jgi:uncharacterized protein (DUF362 family)
VKKAKVAVAHRKAVPGTPGNYDEASLEVVYGMLKEVVDGVGGMKSVIRNGDRVLVRVNACWAAKPDSGVASDPRVVEALMRLIRRETKPRELIVADRSSIGADTSLSFEVTGIGRAALRGGADRILPLEKDERVAVKIPKGRVLIRPVYLAKTMLEADKLIYLSKMKVHKLTQATLTMKMNQGSLDWYDAIRNHRSDMHQKMVDMLKVLRPHLGIIDALWPMQGQGPGSPYPEDLIKDFNVLLAGKDPVALDTVGATIMGFDARHDIPMVRGAEAEGLGTATLNQIEVVGTPIAKVRRHFRHGNINLIGLHPKIEIYLGGVCDGCQHFTRGAIDGYVTNPKMLEGVERISIIVGRNAEIPEGLENQPPKKYVLVIGDCAAQHRDLGTFLPGCTSTGISRTSFVGKSPEEILKAYQSIQPKFNPEGYGELPRSPK